MPWYSVFSSLFFCLEATVKKNTSMRTISVTVMVIISNVLFWKLLDFSSIQLFFSATRRHIDNDIWKVYGSTYMLILYWVNIMKWERVKVSSKLSVTQKSEPVLWRTWHQDISLIIVSFFASQTNLVFKFNLVLIE